jgi:hypothetical protein
MHLCKGLLVNSSKLTPCRMSFRLNLARACKAKAQRTLQPEGCPLRLNGQYFGRTADRAYGNAKRILRMQQNMRRCNEMLGQGRDNSKCKTTFLAAGGVSESSEDGEMSRAFLPMV